MAGGEQRSSPKPSARSAAGAGAPCPLAAVTRPSRRVYAAVCTAMCLQRPGVSIPARSLVRRRRIHSCWWRWEGEGREAAARSVQQPLADLSPWWGQCGSHRHWGSAQASSGSIQRVPPVPPDPRGWLLLRQAVPRAGGFCGSQEVPGSLPCPCAGTCLGAFAAGRTRCPWSRGCRCPSAAGLVGSWEGEGAGGVVGVWGREGAGGAVGARGECQWCWILLDAFGFPAAVQHKPSRSEPVPAQGRRAGSGWTLRRAGAGAEGHFSSPSRCPCPAWDGASPSPAACLALVTPPARLQLH